MKKWLLLFLSITTLAQERVISTAGYASEIIALIGKADKLVGVDTTSIQPIEIMKEKQKIGYRRQLSAEGILSLNPDLILLAPDAGAPAVVEQIKNSGVKLLQLHEEQTLAGIRATIEQIGTALSAEEGTKKLIERVQNDETKFLAAIKEAGNPKIPTLVLIDTGAQGVFGLGKKSAGDKLTAIFGWENTFDAEGNKPVATEALATTNAQIILLASRNDAQKGVVIRPLSENNAYASVLKMTSAGKKGCVFEVNILSALGFGANTARDYLEIFESVKSCF